MTATSAAAAMRNAAERLAEAGVPSPRHDAEALAAWALSVPRGRLLIVSDDAWAVAADRYESAVARRFAREPLQHIIGLAPFRRLELSVGSGVLIPRPETELLVDAVLAWTRGTGLTAPRVADLGTGSGALALAIADEVPGAAVWAVERDPGAMRWARRNVAGTGLRVQLVEADMTDALGEFDGTLDIVVSNPPYLPADVVEVLEPEVRQHDPLEALTAGEDALAGIRAAEAAAGRLLRPGGLAVIEHGADQGETAPGCFTAGWRDVTDFLDLSGRPRYLTAVRT